MIDAPDQDVILARLMSGGQHTFTGDLDAATPVGRSLSSRPLHSPRPEAELGTVLRSLMRKAQSEFLDRGLAVLYLAFGTLDWRDIDDQLMSSPVYLVPVTLVPEGPRRIPRLAMGEDEAVMNPALVMRLKDYDIRLPAVDDLDGLTVSQVLGATKAALSGATEFTGWDLRPTTHLSTFSFAKEAMFKDLQENEDKILDHPVVNALATSDPTQQTSEFQFEPVSPDEIDRVAPPEVTPLVVDADSSQRAAIAAALAGHSFVMDGPPGTGKSQTIANMVAALMHAGKTVLFVSEKIAALDVVKNRLTDAGLGNYLLELHSHKASRRDVAAELLRCLETVSQPPSGLDAPSRDAVRDRRQELNEYARAMNETRVPLNRSLHSVLGVLARTRDAGRLPRPEVDPARFSHRDHRNVQDLIATLARNWRPALQGSSFLWRDIIDESPLEIRLHRAERALSGLQEHVRLNVDVVTAFDLRKPSDTPLLAKLVEHQQQGYSVLDVEHWLMTRDWSSLTRARESLGQEITELRAAEQDVESAAGVTWTALPHTAEAPDSAVPGLSPSAVSWRNMRHDNLLAQASDVEALGDKLHAQLGALSKIAVAMGLPTPETFGDVDGILRLIDIRGQGHSVERRWLTPDGITEARNAAQTLRKRARDLDSAEDRASSVFHAEALKAPLDELQDRFANLHKGLRKLSGRYRADKRAVRALLTEASDVKDGIARLSDAVAWSSKVASYEQAVDDHATILGSHWQGRDTNYQSLKSAIGAAEEVIHLLNGAVPGALASLLCRHDSAESHLSIAAEVRSTLHELQAQRAVRTEITLGSTDGAVDWLRAHVEPMRRAADRVAKVDAATGTTNTVGESCRKIALADRVRVARDAMSSTEEHYRRTFGPYFASADTDLERLDGALAWADELRTLSGGPLDEDQVVALSIAVPVAASERLTRGGRLPSAASSMHSRTPARTSCSKSWTTSAMVRI